MISYKSVAERILDQDQIRMFLRVVVSSLHGHHSYGQIASYHDPEAVSVMLPSLELVDRRVACTEKFWYVSVPRLSSGLETTLSRLGKP